MPFIDSIKTLFSRKGETEKKIALLSERRAALSQQRDTSYDDLAALETSESSLKEQFKTTTSESTKRRLTSQLLQARKDLARKQQLMSVLNQQIDVVSTHLHTLELVQQGPANWAEDRWSEMSRGMGKETEQLNSDEHHLRIFWRRWNELMGANA